MRSKLFVPGSRPGLFTKALASAADAISIDLEDAVSEARKAEARSTVLGFLSGLSTKPDKTLIVRINAMDTPHFEADLAAMTHPMVDIINLPKPASALAVQTMAEQLSKREVKEGISKPIRLLLNIETPEALANASALAQSHARVMGLQVGLVDLFEALGIDRQEPSAVAHVLMSVRLAAGTAKVMALDAAYAKVDDPDGFLREASYAKRLGYSGKSCIHPSQVALANQVFEVSASERAWAEKIVAAARAQPALGAFMLEGQMIDAPFIKRAENILNLTP